MRVRRERKKDKKASVEGFDPPSCFRSSEYYLEDAIQIVNFTPPPIDRKKRKSSGGGGEAEEEEEEVR